MCDRCIDGGSYDEPEPWIELAEHGLTREDQIPHMRDWLARRQASLDQKRTDFESMYPLRRPCVNEFRLDILTSWQFRIDIDRWQLEQFIAGLETHSRDEHGV